MTSETETQDVLPPKEAFVTGEDAKNRIEAIEPSAEIKKSWLELHATNFSWSSTLNESATGGWRLAVSMSAPLMDGVVGTVISQVVPSLEKHIGFVLKAEPDCCTVVENGGKGANYRAHQYTVICGEVDLMSQEMKHMKPFRDPDMKSWYPTPIYSTTNFEDAMRAIRSEITGEPFSKRD